MPDQAHHRRQSRRLRGWDYTLPGAYFVTICTAHRRPFLGHVRNDVVSLSPIGRIVEEEWLRTQQLRENVCLDKFVIMPNHLHGIVVIETAAPPAHEMRTPRRGVPTPEFHRWKSGSLGAIINQFKSQCTRRIRASVDTEFAWQSRFHDHIIRDEPDLNRIRRYIRDNPCEWTLDEYYT